MKTVWIVGHHAVQALMQSNPERAISLHVASPERYQGIIDQARNYGISVLNCDKRSLVKQTSIDNHQGIALQAKPRKEGNEKALEAHIDRLFADDKKPFLLILDQVTDPHNFGACIRTADAAGVDAVIVAKNNASPITPVVQKVASGAVETVNLFRVGNLARVIERIQQQGVWVIGTSDKTDKSLYSISLDVPVAIVMGAEGEGIRQLTATKCDELVKLPMAGKVVSSLNVSVATGVCLYEVVRQRL